MRACLVLLMLASCAAYAQDNGAQAAQQAAPTAQPKFSPKPGTYSPDKYVTIKDSTAQAVIYYTTDGSTPTGSSRRYTGPLPIASTTTLKAIALAPRHAQSEVASGMYQVRVTPLAGLLGGG